MDYSPSSNQSGQPPTSDQPPAAPAVPDSSQVGSQFQPNQEQPTESAAMNPDQHSQRKSKRPDDYEEEEGEITDDDEEYDPRAYAKPPQASSSLLQNIHAAARLNVHSPEKSKKKKKDKRDPYEFPGSDEEATRPSPSKSSKHKHKHHVESPSTSEPRPAPVEKASPSKKVPPLRISLAPKLDEDAEPTPSRSIEPNTSGPSAESTPQPESKKPSTRSGGKKTAAQTNRVTRSQRRAEEDSVTPRRRTGPSNSLLATFEHYDDDEAPGTFNEEDEEDMYYQQMLPQGPPPEKAWEIIQKNSFAGNKEFTALMRDAWMKMWPLDDDTDKAPPTDLVIPNYEKFMMNVRDYRTANENQQNPHEHPPAALMNPKVPQLLRDVFISHIDERKEKKARFEKERNHLQLYGEREYIRALFGTMIQERTTYSIISRMRDETTFNPINFDSYQKEPEHPSRVPQTVPEVIAKLKEKALTLFNKQSQETEVLYKAHWKAAIEAFYNVGIQAPAEAVLLKLVPKIYVHHVNFDYLEDPKLDEDDDEVAKEAMKPPSPGFLEELEAEYAEIGGPNPDYVSKREQKMAAELAELEAEDDELDD